MFQDLSIKSAAGGFVVQEKDLEFDELDTFNIVTQKKVDKTHLPFTFIIFDLNKIYVRHIHFCFLSYMLFITFEFFINLFIFEKVWEHGRQIVTKSFF